MKQNERCELNMKYNQLIKQWRKEAELTLEQLAEQLHITPQALSFYENGKRTLTLEMIEKIADILEKEVIVSFRNKTIIPLTKRQQRLISYVFYEEKDIKEQYKKYKEMFDITDEEIDYGKLFDDMDENEYVRESPYEMVFRETENGFEEHFEQIHSRYQILHYLSYGCEVEYDVYGNIKIIHIDEDVPPFTPPKRISKEGFIYDQRRMLLYLLMDCFEKKESEIVSFDYEFFKEIMGI